MLLESCAMTKERTLFDLPNYRGQLSAVSWSQVSITPALEQSLKAAALRNCPSCGGQGYRIQEAKAHPCVCLNRKDTPPAAPTL